MPLDECFKFDFNTTTSTKKKNRGGASASVMMMKPTRNSSSPSLKSKCTVSDQKELASSRLQKRLMVPIRLGTPKRVIEGFRIRCQHDSVNEEEEEQGRALFFGDDDETYQKFIFTIFEKQLYGFRSEGASFISSSETLNGTCICLHNLSEKRRLTWCPGKMSRETWNEPCSTVEEEASMVKPGRKARDVAPLLPFEDLIKESLDKLGRKARDVAPFLPFEDLVKESSVADPCTEDNVTQISYIIPDILTTSNFSPVKVLKR